MVTRQRPLIVAILLLLMLALLLSLIGDLNISFPTFYAATEWKSVNPPKEFVPDENFTLDLESTDGAKAQIRTEPDGKGCTYSGEVDGVALGTVKDPDNPCSVNRIISWLVVNGPTITAILGSDKAQDFIKGANRVLSHYFVR